MAIECGLRAVLAVAFLALAIGGIYASTKPFDYYVLSLSWAPGFCAQSGNATANPQECAAGRHIGFVVHGLWPQTATGTSPGSCGGPASVPRGVMNSLLPYMFSQGLIRHEWITHGSCSGLNSSAYFTTLLLARAAVQVPVQISGIAQDEQWNPAQIEEQFAAANPGFSRSGFRVACRNSALTEVRACFSKELDARVCTENASECTEREITIRAPR